MPFDSDTLGANATGSLELEALERELTSLVGQINAGNYRFLRLLAEFDRRGGHYGLGIVSCAHWLSWRCGIGLIAARDKVRVARALEHLPVIRDAMSPVASRNMDMGAPSSGAERVLLPSNTGALMVNNSLTHRLGRKHE